MYAFLTGPMLWAAFIICAAGLLFRVIWYIKGLNWQLDRVAYSAYPGLGFKGAVRSVLAFLLPFASVSWRKKPIMTLLTFVFHIGIVFVPIFLAAHVIIVQERWGVSWPVLPQGLADFLSIAMLIAGVLLILRRIALPEVRILTNGHDYLVLAIAMAPFLTGLMARFGAPGYDFWLLSHIISGEVMLIAMPFTKLSHVVLFFCSRAQLGMDYGIKRGGQKGTNMAW